MRLYNTITKTAALLNAFIIFKLVFNVSAGFLYFEFTHLHFQFKNKFNQLQIPFAIAALVSALALCLFVLVSFPLCLCPTLLFSRAGTPGAAAELASPKHPDDVSQQCCNLQASPDLALCARRLTKRQATPFMEDNANYVWFNLAMQGQTKLITY